MNDLYPFVIFISAMLVMSLLFFVVFIIIVRYLVTVHNLNKQIKENEPHLWADLGKPETFAFLHQSFNPFKALHAQMRFCRWFLKGGEGATESATTELVTKSKRLFRLSMIWFISLFAVYFVLVISAILFASFSHHYNEIKQERNDAILALKQNSVPHKTNRITTKNKSEFIILSKNIDNDISVNDIINISTMAAFDDGEKPLIPDKLELTVLQNIKITKLQFDDKGNASVAFDVTSEDLKAIIFAKEKGELLVKKAQPRVEVKSVDFDAFEAHIKQYVKERK